MKCPELPVPAPVPTAGTPCGSRLACIHRRIVVVVLIVSPPDFGRFNGSRGAVYCRLPRSPKTSLIAHANTGYGRTG